MENKEKFIEEIDKLIENMYDYDQGFKGLSDEANKFLEDLKNNKNDSLSSLKGLTEKGKKILEYMKDNYNDYNNVFSAKRIAEGLFVSSKSIGGSMRSLIRDGYVKKIDLSPTTYGITEEGLDLLK